MYGDFVMIPQRLITFYIDHLSYEDADNFASKYGVKFTNDELNILVPFVKLHKNDMHRHKKNYLLEEIKKVVEPTTYQKIDYLLNQLLP